ncbi:MAG: DNA helicase UvrD [Candidatus Aenigmarchaeota archaeon]|nr:DNA helicase UvrD [Candidatus Aenigmarchaeota archaeon]
MKIVADLQIHSRFARACSKDLSFETLEKYAKIKGTTLLGTGDFQHPIWNKEIKANLKEDENGILWSKTGFPFLWQTEVSLMYSQGGKGRRIHNLIFSPNQDVSDQITEALGKKGRLDYDGRPIFGFSCIELVEMMNSISDKIEIIPAHCMTPWFGLFGSKTGFDSIKECFQEKAKYIHAVETGLSADPGMMRRLSFLDNIQLVSFSDAHSYWPWRLGREVTVFDVKKLSYDEILKAIKTGEGLSETIEVDPSYGKYHVDGHRLCGINLDPKESKKIGEICPKCKKKLTIGVLSRIEQLADRPEGYKAKNAPGFKSVIPLSEIISFTIGTPNPASRKVWEIYHKLIEKFGSEFNVLADAKPEDMTQAVDKQISENIIRIRNGQVKILPGFDGIYGVPVFKPEDEEKLNLLRMKSAEKEKSQIGEEEKNTTKTKQEKTTTKNKKPTLGQKGLLDFAKKN